MQQRRSGETGQEILVLLPCSPVPITRNSRKHLNTFKLCLKFMCFIMFPFTRNHLSTFQAPACFYFPKYFRTSRFNTDAAVQCWIFAHLKN